MKREDLYALRGRTASSSRRKTGSQKHQSWYPFCHLLQLVVSIICLLVVGLSSSVFPEMKVKQFHAQLKKELCTTVQLPTENWDGSLAALFISPE